MERVCKETANKYEEVLVETPRAIRVFSTLFGAGFIALAFWSGVTYWRLVAAETEISDLRSKQTSLIVVIERVENIRTDVAELHRSLDQIRNILLDNAATDDLRLHQYNNTKKLRNN